MYSTNSSMFVTGIMRFFRSICPRGVQNRISLEAAILCNRSEPSSWFLIVALLIVRNICLVHAGKDNRIVNLFTKGLHHRNLSVIYIVQNLFHQRKGNRSISLFNSHYLDLFKNPRGVNIYSRKNGDKNIDNAGKQEYFSTYLPIFVKDKF